MSDLLAILPTLAGWPGMRFLTVANAGRTWVVYGDVARGLATLDEAAKLPTPSGSDLPGQLQVERANALLLLGRLPEARDELARATAAATHSGHRTLATLHAVRRRYLVAMGHPADALRDLAEHPLPTDDATPPVPRFRHLAEAATLRLAAGDAPAARGQAAAALAKLEPLPQRPWLRDAEADLTLVVGEADLRDGRPGEAAAMLARSLALHLQIYDADRSPAVARVRRALAEARRAADGRHAAAG